MKKVTIKDIAAYANVSIATVSRAISEPEKVSPHTQEVIQKAVKELGYYPSIIAQGMRKQINNIGVILNRNTEDSFFSPYLSEVLRGLVKAAKELGYFIQILTCERDEDGCFELISLYKSRRVDGYILLSSKLDDIFIQTLLKESIPFILHGNTGSKQSGNQVYSIDIDNVEAAKTLVKHLLELGHHEIAMVNSSTDYVYNYERLQGYRQALIEHGLKINAQLICETSETFEESAHEIYNLLQQNPEITAIVCKSDINARQIIQIIDKMQLQVPENISLVCFNATYAATMAEPLLTTISIPIYQMGSKLLKSLVALLNNEVITKRQLFPYELIIGNSCRRITN